MYLCTIILTTIIYLNKWLTVIWSLKLIYKNDFIKKNSVSEVLYTSTELSRYVSKKSST